MRWANRLSRPSQRTQTPDDVWLGAYSIPTDSPVAEAVLSAVQSWA